MENAADERIKSLEEENRDLKSALKEKDAARKTHEALIEQLSENEKTVLTYLTSKEGESMEISTMQDEIANQIFTDIKDTQGRTLTGIVKRGKVANLLTEKFEFVEKVQEENTSKYKIPDNVEEQMIAQLRRFG